LGARLAGQLGAHRPSYSVHGAGCVACMFTVVPQYKKLACEPGSVAFACDKASLTVLPFENVW